MSCPWPFFAIINHYIEKYLRSQLFEVCPAEMRVYVKTQCGVNERTFEIACGGGDKSFKWLGTVAAQRYSLACPNGALRRKDDYRGATQHNQQHAVNIVLSSGKTPHPAANISDYLRDEDEVSITLISSLDVNKHGTATATNWATLAFTSGDSYGNEVEQESENEESKVDQIDEFTVKERARAKFMRIIMGSQMLNTKYRSNLVLTAWDTTILLVPRLSEAEIDTIKEVVYEEWGVLEGLFQIYTEKSPIGRLELKDFQRLIEDTEVFDSKDSAILSARIYSRIDKGMKASLGSVPNGLCMGAFIAALLLTSQTRHNDTYEVVGAKRMARSPKDFLQEIMRLNFRPLARRKFLTSLLKEVICSEKFLIDLSDRHDDLMAVFEKYAGKRNRDVFTSLPFENTAEVLLDAQIYATKDIPQVGVLFSEICKGSGTVINGRDKSINPPFADDEVLFAEFVECIVRANYDVTLAKLGYPKVVVPKREDDDEEKKEEAVEDAAIPEIDIYEICIDGLQKAIATLTLVEAPVQKGYYRGP